MTTMSFLHGIPNQNLHCSLASWEGNYPESVNQVTLGASEKDGRAQSEVAGQKFAQSWAYLSFLLLIFLERHRTWKKLVVLGSIQPRLSQSRRSPLQVRRKHDQCGGRIDLAVWGATCCTIHPRITLHGYACVINQRSDITSYNSRIFCFNSLLKQVLPDVSKCAIVCRK